MTRPRKPPPAIPAPDAAVLRHAGLLGHTYVLVVTYAVKDGPNGSTSYRDKAYESCDRERSKKLAKDAYADRAPALYQQVSHGVWLAVKLAP